MEEREMRNSRTDELAPDFEYEPLVEIPSDANVSLHYFPQNPTGVGRDGAIVRFKDKRGESWVGIFAFGDGSREQGVITKVGPSRDHLIVVARGAAYVVHVTDRAATEVTASPVFATFVSKAHGLVLFHDFTKVVAYGVCGLAWKSDRLSWNGIRNAVLIGDTLDGEAWDAPDERWVPFSVDVAMGSHQGGSAPPQ